MHKVLIVDDDLDFSYALKILLELKHFDADFVSDGCRALEVLDKSHVDLLITDNMMPGPSGEEVIAQMRDGKTNKWTPAILLDYHEPQNRDQLTSYLKKPINIKELLQEVNGRLNSRLAGGAK